MFMLILILNENGECGSSFLSISKFTVYLYHFCFLFRLFVQFVLSEVKVLKKLNSVYYPLKLDKVKLSVANSKYT